MLPAESVVLLPDDELPLFCEHAVNVIINAAQSSAHIIFFIISSDLVLVKRVVGRAALPV